MQMALSMIKSSVFASTICKSCYIKSRMLSASSVIKQNFSQVDDFKTPVTPDAGFEKLDSSKTYTSANLPLITSRKLLFPSTKPSKQAWLETVGTLDNDVLGIVDLHPEIFGVFPRLDMLWWNVFWQSRYKKIDYDFARSRAEMPGGGRKPWVQKKMGKARHGSIRSPLWSKGGKAHGPRGPKSNFFMLGTSSRLWGLRTALTVKYAQNNLHIVDNLDLPSDDSSYLMNLVELKNWGLSVLFVDDSDYIPENMAAASDDIKQYNVMPVYGLNVYSMLKHETLVLTIDALDKIEERLLFHINNIDHRDKKFKPSSLPKPSA